MSNLLLNNNTTQPLITQPPVTSPPQSTNAGGNDQDGTSVAVPDDKDPDSYRLQYQTAINEGRTPDAAAKAAYKNSADRVNTDEGPHGKDTKASSQDTSRSQSQGASSNEQSAKAEDASGKGGAKGAAKGTEGTSSASYVANPSKDSVDTQSRSRTVYALPADETTSGGHEPPVRNSQTLSQVGDIASDSVVSQSPVQPAQVYSLMVDNGVAPDEADTAAHNTTADLTADEHGNVQAGTEGTIPLGDVHKRLAAAPPETQKQVADVSAQLVSNPVVVQQLAKATDPKEIQDIINKNILATTVDSMAGYDENGNKKSSITGGGGSGKKGSKVASLNPMEMVMVAMMNAAVEGQKQAQGLAEEVQANTDTKRELRELKTQFGNKIKDDGESPGSASASGASGASGGTTDTSAWTNADKSTNVKALLQQAPSTDKKKNQAAYQSISDALDSAGDDSSILMIKLQTAAQIVTTFLQACSNVSKGVTDTTKAVIGNIGH